MVSRIDFADLQSDRRVNTPEYNECQTWNTIRYAVCIVARRVADYATSLEKKTSRV